MTTLTNDGLLMLAEHLNVQTLPSILSTGPRHHTVEAWERARAEADATLLADGLVDSYGDVDGEAADALYVLSRPDAELVARIHGTSGPRMLCLARRGHQHALGIRVGDTTDRACDETVAGEGTIELRRIWADDNPVNLARPIIEALGRCEPADIVNFSAPAAELAMRFNVASGSGESASSLYAEAVYHHGVDHRDAVNFGLAMATCHGHAEIVACTYDDGLAGMATGAVAVYDTDRGRIVASPGAAPDGSIWSTITPGTDHRIAQAISALIGTLPGERWMPSF